MFKDHIDMTDGTVQITEGTYKEIVRQCFIECRDLCLEGEIVFKKMGSNAAGVGCGTCADNIHNVIIALD